MAIHWKYVVIHWKYVVIHWKYVAIHWSHLKVGVVRGLILVFILFLSNPLYIPILDS